MFLLSFLKIYGVMLYYISPVVAFLIGLIVLLGLRTARIEEWPRSRGIYCAFITATTVGYGVVHPTKPRTRVLAIITAFIGLILTGIIVALAFQSLQLAAQDSGLINRLASQLTHTARTVPAP